MAKADALFRQRRPGRPVKAKPTDKDIKTGFDGNWDRLVVRKCNITFNKNFSEVTSSQIDTRIHNDELLKRRCRKRTEMRPFQAMWAKRLSGMQVSIPVEKYDKVDIADQEFVYESIKPIGLIKPGTSVLTPEEAVSSVIQQMNNGFMTNGTFGQPINKDKLDANFMAHASHDQPLCERIPIHTINEEIANQEKRVLDARKRLQEVMKYFG